MKIFKQAWIYSFALAAIGFLIYPRLGTPGEMGFTSLIVGFAATAALVGGGLFSLAMSIINALKKPLENGKSLTQK